MTHSHADAPSTVDQGRARRLRAVVASCTSGAVIMALVTASLVPTQAQAAAQPTVANTLPTYNEIWTSKSTDSTASMPIGNGVQAANVWVEGNSLKLLLAAGDAWDEDVHLNKLGRLNISFTPNPFAAGPFRQELKLREGEITITAGTNPVITTRIWADAKNESLHVESNAPTNFTMQVDFDNVHPTLNTTPDTSQFNYYDLGGSTDPYPPRVTPDTVYTRSNELLWNHHNADSRYDEIMKLESLDPAAFNDPLTGRTYGGLIQGPGFTTASPSRLVSTATAAHRLDINLHSEINKSANWLSAWETAISQRANTVASASIDQLRTGHRSWWDAYWNRSYIFATGDADADIATRGWLNARYLQASAGRTDAMPIRFNGSLFTVGKGADVDFRPWNSYHQFNQRFVYWSMLQSGDFDLMQPYFDQYVKSLPLAIARVKAFWGNQTTANGVTLPPTQGAMWHEVMGLWGQTVASEYGWDRTGHTPDFYAGNYTRYLYTGNIEMVAMMLDYYSYTGDETFARTKLLPVAREVVKFYDTHWPRKNGKIDMYPAYSGENDRNVENPAGDTAGLHRVVNELLTFPNTLATSADLTYWSQIRDRLPALPIGATVDDNDSSYGPNDRLKTASNLFQGTETNNQNLYPIFPMRLFGNGQPNLALAVASYNDRKGQYPTSGAQDWRHDATQAAYLGLTDEAKFQTVAAFRKGDWRFQGFGPGGVDGRPGQESPAIGKIALQAMLLHPSANGDSILYNAWPSTWDVRFKVYTTNHRTVEGSRIAGNSTYSVTPGAGKIIVGSGTATGSVTTQYAWKANPTALPLAGQIDADGHGDLAVWETNGSVYARYGDGTGQFGRQTLSSWAATGTKIAGDFNGDGKLDIGVWNAGTTTIRYGNGTGGFVNQTTSSAPANPAASVVVGDYDGDGRADLAIWEPSGNLYVRYGDGAGGFGRQTLTQWNITGPRIAGDFNGDKRADLAVFDGTARLWRIRHSDGTGKFTGETTYSKSAPDNALPFTTDVDGDGFADLGIWTQATGQWTVNYDAR